MTSFALERSKMRSAFYVWMAVAFMTVAVVGFTPVYIAKMMNGTFHGNPIMHIHGVLFFSWTVLVLVQTYFAATGRVTNHRSLGMIGISLMTAMVITVVLAAINSYKVAEIDNQGDAARQFSIVSLLGAATMAAMFATAIVYVSKPEIHKRLMISLNAIMMNAPLGRVFMVLLAPPDAKGPPPVEVTLGPAIVILAFFAAGMIYDWRTRGRPHPTYLVGLSVHVLYSAICLLFARSDTWMAIAKGIESLAG